MGIKTYKTVLLAATAALVFGGCAQKSVEEFNKPADYWYKKIVKDIARGELDEADKSFTSLQSEHIHSPLISDAMLMLSTAHSDSEEYILANYYLDEYIKRYGDKKSVEFAKYLKLKANFQAFKRAYRDQKLIMDTQKEIEGYLSSYPNSPYAPYVKTMFLKLSLADKALKENVAQLYERIDKPEAAKKYREDANVSWLDGIEYEKADTPWYRALFEMQF